MTTRSKYQADCADLHHSSTSQIVVQSKLDRFLLEFQEGKREGSILSNETAESLSRDDKQIWRTIRKKLEDVGVTTTAFNANKDFIIRWFRNALSTGAFEEFESSLHRPSGQLEYHDTCLFQYPDAQLPASHVSAYNIPMRRDLQSALSRAGGSIIQSEETPDVTNKPRRTLVKRLNVPSVGQMQQKRTSRDGTLLSIIFWS